MGFDEKMINKVYILLRPQNIDGAIDYMTEINGIYNHNFFGSANPKEKNLCFICKKGDKIIWIIFLIYQEKKIMMKKI